MNHTRELKNFIYSQYFSDGLRITFGVLLPSVLLAQIHLLQLGMTISLGAFAVSISDNVGPALHKRNGILYSIASIVIIAFITGLINQHLVLLIGALFLFCFFFSMLTVYGDRASNIGSGSLLIMILTIDQKLGMEKNLLHAGALLTGGIWYFILSMSIIRILPYRLSQQALGGCIRKVAEYLRVKADFYRIDKDYDSTYQKLIAEQIVVHEEQETVREILFKTRQILKESTQAGRQLILVFVDMVDLFEQTMATHYDYKKIRQQFGQTEPLQKLYIIILKIAEELENLSFHITSNEKPQALFTFQNELEQLKIAIDNVESEQGINNLVLKKILINIKNIVNRIQKIYSYYHQKQVQIEQSRKYNLGYFVSHQDYDIKLFKDNLSFNSSTFRYSVRVGIVAVIGYLISVTLPLGHHSYWILLTILVILKPGFSLTKKRNYQRLIGTFIGGIAGALIVMYVKDQIALFMLMVAFMLAAYSFLRLNYVVGVLFMTPYVLIMLSFTGLGGIAIAQERVFDTFVGCIIALTASYYILPSWEFYQLKKFMRAAVLANYNYLRLAGENLAGRQLNMLDYKLARKAVYVTSADLASAFQRMLSEPKSKQKDVKDIHKFVVLNHILSSYIATLIYSTKQSENLLTNSTHLKIIKRTLYQLGETARKLDAENDKDFKEFAVSENSLKVIEESPETLLLTEELEFIYQVCNDIHKISQRID